MYSHYGHYELAVLAGFCEYSDTYHVLPQYGYAQLLDQNGEVVKEKGKVGEIVTTSFLMDATLFIRYRTRDYAVYEGDYCSKCGRPFQIWSKIIGRLQEFAITSDNRKIAMTAINMHDNIFDSVKQFQFHQKVKGEIIFNYIPKKKISKQELNMIIHKLQFKFGKTMKIIPVAVKEILPTARGKHRFLIQELKINYCD